jgi:uncharacterized protein (TIGR03000 family)
MTMKKCLLTAVVAIGAVVVLSEDSQAFFGRWRGGSCGSSGGSWGSWGGGGSHGSWGSRGSHGGWGSHGGNWGGSHGGSWGGSHGGSWGGGHYGRVHYSDGLYARNVVRTDRIVVRERRNETIASLPAVKTRLTLRVPSEAKVTLAGVATKQSGEVRNFTTTRLSAGQVWDDYKVVVELERDGQTLREERSLKLTGGQPQELSIDFASNQLAQR